MKKKKLNIKLTLKLKLFLFIFVIISSILIGLIILNSKEEKLEMNEYKNELITFTYDNNFKIINEKEQIELKSIDNKATIVIKILDYTSISKQEDKQDIATSLSYQVIKNKNDYYETYNDVITENNITRYYYLYENYQEQNQIEIITTFDEKYIYVVIYQANNEEFDLYEESISIIVNSIEL